MFMLVAIPYGLVLVGSPEEYHKMDHINPLRTENITMTKQSATNIFEYSKPVYYTNPGLI